MALAALAGAMLLWSGTFIAMKVSLTAFHPMFILLARMLVSALLLAPFMPRWSREVRYVPGDWRIFALMVLCEPCLYFLFEGYALQYTSASQASLIIAVMPLTVAVGAWFLFKERISKAAWIGLFLALGGIAMLTLSGEKTEQAPDPLLGNTLEFGAVFMATAYALCVARLRGYPAFGITAVQAIGGTLFFGVLVCVMPGTIPTAFPQVPTLSLLFLCVLTCVAYGLYNYGVARLSAARAAAMINLIPALTLVMGITFLGETFTLAQYCSLLPIAAGVVLSQMGKVED